MEPQQQQQQSSLEGSYPRGEKRSAGGDGTYWGETKEGRQGDESSSRPAKMSNWDTAPSGNTNTTTGGDDDGKFHKDVPLPHWAAGKVIGKQGDTIKRIQRQTHCEIKSDNGERDTEGNRSLHLVGDTQATLNACAAAIEEIIFTCRKPIVGPGDSKKEVVISNDIAAKVIGYRGCVIDEIKRRSHTRIEVVPTEDGGPGEERTVVLVGPEENCEEGARIVREIVSGELDVSPIIDDFKREHQLDEYDPSGGKGGKGYHGKGGKGSDWRGSSKGGWGNDSARYTSGDWSGGKGGWGKGGDYGGKGGFGKGGDDSSNYYGGGGKGYAPNPAPYGGKGGAYRSDPYGTSRYGGKGYEYGSKGGSSDSYGGSAGRFERAAPSGGDYYGKGSYGGGKGGSASGYAYSKGGKGGFATSSEGGYGGSWGGKGKGKGGGWSTGGGGGGGWDSSPEDSPIPQSGGGGPSSYSSRPWGGDPSPWGGKGRKGGYGY